MNIERKKKGKNFIYLKKNVEIKDAKILERIKKLVIPPAWRDVVIADKPTDKVQCIGYDDKNRKQYKYNQEYIDKQTKDKYYKNLIEFGLVINKIREDIEQMLRKREWNLDKLIAFIIFVVDNSHLRIGNEKYKDENESYGITTLERRHIIIKTNSVILNFIGKKGVENSCKLTDKRIVNLFKSLDKEFKPREDEGFFKYYGGNNKVYSINSLHINDFLKNYGDFSAKIFRTWTANEFIIKYLYNIVFQIKDVDKSYMESLSDKNCAVIINKCIDQVSEKLNNTRAICKKSYICNDIFDDFKESPCNFIKKIKNYSNKKLKNCNGIQTILIKLLSNYKN